MGDKTTIARRLEPEYGPEYGPVLAVLTPQAIVNAPDMQAGCQSWA